MGPAAVADMNDRPHQAEPAFDSFASEKVYDESAQKWERVYAMCVHLTLLLAGVLAPVVPGLIMWVIKKDESTFVDDHGREAVNFQISLLIYTIAMIPIGFATCTVGFWVLGPAIAVLAVVGLVLSSIAAYKGRYYRYPACIRFIKDRGAF